MLGGVNIWTIIEIVDAKIRLIIFILRYYFDESGQEGGERGKQLVE